MQLLCKDISMCVYKVAGCTLDAGAKIYASRVDSIYTDAYKILGGIGKKNHSKAGAVGKDMHVPLRWSINTV